MSATAADPRTGRVGGFGALFFCFALCVVVCLLAVGGIFEEVVTVRLFNLVVRSTCAQVFVDASAD